MTFARLFGRLCRHISLLFGGSPVGKKIRITITEGFIASEMGKVLVGNIIDVVHLHRSSHSNSIEACPIIRLDTPGIYGGHRLESFVGVPRHVGYGLYSLPFTAIAVYIVPVHNSEKLEVFKLEDAVAIWLLSLS